MKVILTLLLIACFSFVQAGDLQMEYPVFALLAESGQHVDSLDMGEAPSMTKEKSVLRAGFYSLILPGTGELYARSYWKAALFFGIEVASWTVYATYTGKGDAADNDMKAFANVHWSEHRYWTKVYETALNNLPASETSHLPDMDRNGDHLIDDEYYTPEYISKLRDLEGKDGMGFSHRLPESKTQQYYEMIYKYPHQFANAWDDAVWEEQYNGNSNKITDNMSIYRDMRNDMNDLYNTASTALNVVVINHLLSALDAAWTARKFNRSITVSLKADIKRYAYKPVQMYGIQINW